MEDFCHCPNPLFDLYNTDIFRSFEPISPTLPRLQGMESPPRLSLPEDVPEAFPVPLRFRYISSLRAQQTSLENNCLETTIDFLRRTGL